MRVLLTKIVNQTCVCVCWAPSAAENLHLSAELVIKPDSIVCVCVCNEVTYCIIRTVIAGFILFL